MEGPIAPMDCVSEDETEQSCPLIPTCETRPVWIKVRDSIAEAIDSVSLADLVAQSPRKNGGLRLVPAAGAEEIS